MDNDKLAEEIKELRMEIVELRTTIADHFNPEYHPNIANEVYKLNALLPDLIEAMKKK